MVPRLVSPIVALALVAVVSPGPALAQGQDKPLPLAVPGIDTFHPVTTTIACGSNARPESMPALASAGFKSVVSFREDGEAGYDRAEAERAAIAAGLRFVSIPFNRDHPDAAAVERFLEVIAAPDISPAYLYCHSGQRVATMWLIKRVKQDGWTPAQALAEAESIGLTNPGLKAFAMEYAARK